MSYRFNGATGSSFFTSPLLVPDILRLMLVYGFDWKHESLIEFYFRRVRASGYMGEYVLPKGVLFARTSASGYEPNGTVLSLPLRPTIICRSDT